MKRYLLLIAGLLTLSTIVSAQEKEKKVISPDGTYMFEKETMESCSLTYTIQQKEAKHQ